MTNFEDFIKVTQEAKKNLDNMKICLSNSKNELAEIKENKYESILKFWREVADMVLKLGCGNTQILIPTPIQNGCSHKIYFKLWVTNHNSIQFGVYDAHARDGIDISTRFRRWMCIPATYKEYLFRNEEGLSDIANLMYENWEEYQPKFEVAVKEMVTEYLAQQLRETEEQFVNVQNDIESEKS